MKIQITGKNFEASPYLKDIVEKKIGKLDKYFKPDTTVYITLKVEHNRHICEVTIPLVGGNIIRAEEVTGDMYSSIDNVVDKLESQVIKHKTKLAKKLHDDAFKTQIIKESNADVPADDEPRKIVRTKRFSFKPMSVEEAILQMELISHPFYVFHNADTGQTNVLYLRKDNNLGLIEPGNDEDDE